VVRSTDTVLVSTIKLKRLEVLTLFEPAVLPQRNIKCAQLRHITALCRWSTAVQVLEEVSRIVMLIMLLLLLMLMLLLMLLPLLQNKTALSGVSRVAKKKVKGLAKKYDAFLASDTLIKQIPRLLGPGLKKVGSNIYEVIIAGIIALYQGISD